MKFVFFGSNQISVTVLDALRDAGYLPDLIVTVPDDAAGRKHIITPPPLKQAYANQGLKFIQPVSLKDPAVFNELKSIRADMAIVAAYRKFIPDNILGIFPHGALNVHPSLLPRWRGPSPVQSAIWNGDDSTGVSIILLDNEMDHGPILAQEEISIESDEYFGQLYDRLGKLAGKILVKTIPAWLKDKITPVAQDHSAATFSKIISWGDGEVDCHKPVSEVYNQIRALSHEPGCWIKLPQDKDVFVLKILSARPITSNESITVPAGLHAYNKLLVLGCANSGLVLDQVQPQGKRPMSGKEFINGYHEQIS